MSHEFRDAYEMTEQQAAFMEGCAMRPDDMQVGGDHYTRMPVQPWSVIDTWPKDQRIGYYRGNAIKYLLRMGSKDQSAQEIGKARHYLDKLIETLAAQ